MLLQTLLGSLLILCIPFGRADATPSPLASQPNPNAFQNLTIDYSDGEHAQSTDGVLRFLLSSEGTSAAEHVQSVVVVGQPLIGDWDLVNSVMKQLGSVQDVHWRSRAILPPSLIKTLNDKQPPLRLHYTIPLNDHIWDWQPNPSPISPSKARKYILGSSTLYSLHASIDYGGNDDPQYMEIIQEILQSCPNLRHFDLSLGHSGCVMGNNIWAFDFDHKLTKPLPPLESLRLSGYDLECRPNSKAWKQFITGYQFDQMMFPWTKLPKRALDIIGLDNLAKVGAFRSVWPIYGTDCKPGESVTNLDVFMKRLDWSQLKVLSLSSRTMPFALTRLKGSMPVLEDLHLSGLETENSAVASTFFSELPALKALRLDWMAVEELEGILTSLWGRAEAMTTLQINTARSPWEYNKPPRAYFNATQLGELRAEAPLISSLDIDAERSDDLPEDILGELAHMLSLTHLTLRYNAKPNNLTRQDPYWMHTAFLEVNDSGFRDDVVSRGSTSKLFGALRKIKQGKVLDRLDVYVGPWESREENAMMQQSEKLSAHWTCELDGSGQEVCDGTEYVADY